MNKILVYIVFVCISGWVLSAYADSTADENRTYTLYRNAPSTEEARIHVATFDSIAYSSGDQLDEMMNKRNCERVADMYQEQQMWKDTKFWCEKGKYRK